MMIVSRAYKSKNPAKKQQEVHKTNDEMPKRLEEERRERFAGLCPANLSC